jgi:triacylglycerol lipase
MLLRRIAVTITLAAAAAAATTAATPAAATTIAATPNPVILVAGLSGPSIAYEPLAARLRGDGYRVFIYQLPGLGFGDIPESARAFGTYLAQLKASLGASKVDVVGHSEGGLVARYYLKSLGGTTNVQRYISLGTPQYGTAIANIIRFLARGDCIGITACQQMAVGSTFLAGLNAGDDTPGAVRYTAIRTAQDELVRPVDNARLDDGATNLLIQSRCPLRIVGHLGLILDGTTYTAIHQALTDQPINPRCFAI